MIKLIATDMDGTLLDENHELPKNFFETLGKLKEKNIKFAIASGRPYVTLYENFKPYSNELYFICDNGSYIVEPGHEPIISFLDRDLVNSVVNTCKNIDGVNLILCGVKHSYIVDSSEEFRKEIDKYYINKKIVSDFNEVDEDIFKIAICDYKGAKDNSYPIINPLYKDKCKVVVSGALWVDINNSHINKGEALKKLQKDYNISYDETMVFGDFYNDIEMLQNAKYSFVMENANDEIKQYGNYIAKSNSENGVISAIEEYILDR